MRKNMRLVITPQGKLLVRLPQHSEFGAFTVQDNRILMQYGGKVWVATFRFDGDTLYLLRRGENAEGAFDRVTY
jgi:hypothetical protein